MHYLEDFCICTRTTLVRMMQPCQVMVSLLHTCSIDLAQVQNFLPTLKRHCFNALPGFVDIHQLGFSRTRRQRTTSKGFASRSYLAARIPFGIRDAEFVFPMSCKGIARFNCLQLVKIPAHFLACADGIWICRPLSNKSNKAANNTPSRKTLRT